MDEEAGTIPNSTVSSAAVNFRISGVDVDVFQMWLYVAKNLRQRRKELKTAFLVFPDSYSIPSPDGILGSLPTTAGYVFFPHLRDDFSSFCCL